MTERAHREYLKQRLLVMLLISNGNVCLKPNGRWACISGKMGEISMRSPFMFASLSERTLVAHTVFNHSRVICCWLLIFRSTLFIDQVRLVQHQQEERRRAEDARRAWTALSASPGRTVPNPRNRATPWTGTDQCHGQRCLPSPVSRT